jgi:L-ascorbate metabolism protein UlaG (beta-lactamase superfamily)/DNA-binding beta-propeller fold protein YncE
MNLRCCLKLNRECLAALLLCLTAPAQADSIPAENGDIVITPLVHSSVQLQYQGMVIQIDPWSAISMSNYQIADLILITDNPSHHLDTAAITALRDSETILIAPANSASQLSDADAVIMGGGDSRRVKIADVEVLVEVIDAYDLTPGAPAHPKGDANGYVLTIGGKRLLFAGVTECVDELKTLVNIDVAFMPLNIPPARMTPADSAACTRQIDPDIVYSYHYDQSYARRVNDPEYEGNSLPGGLTVDESMDAFGNALQGSGIEYRQSNWYPPRFQLDSNWPQLPLGQRWLTGGLGGMCIGRNDEVYLLNRQNVVEDDLDAALLAPPIVQLDAQGNTVKGWGDAKLIGGRLHDCHANADGSLWLVPAATGHIQLWSANQELLMQIGEDNIFDSSDGSRSGQPLNSNSAQFFLPGAVDVDESTGEIFVADGELPGGNSRIAVFDSSGNFLRQWTLQRDGNDQRIELPHCLRVSNDGLVYVCDRRADRIQVFDRAGNLRRNISLPFTTLSDASGRVSGDRGNAVVLAFSPDPLQEFLYVLNQNSVAVEVLERTSGDWLTRFGEGPGRYPGQFELPHGIAVDSKGNVYVAEQEGRRVQRFLVR